MRHRDPLWSHSNGPILVGVLAAVLAALAAPISGAAIVTNGAPPQAAAAPRVIVLAFDGLDAGLAEAWMASGDLPHLKAMADAGGYARLGTTDPPLSPVTWPTVLSGVNPGRHGLFDFIARTNDGPIPFPRPATVGWQNVQGTAVAGVLGDPEETFSDVMDLWPETVRLQRGQVFAPFLHEYLDAAGRTFVGLRVPATFPVTTPLRQSRLLSGLFAPDVAGGPGRWFIYTTDRRTQDGLPTETGGIVFRLQGAGEALESSLPGPEDWVRRAKLATTLEGFERELAETTDPDRKASLEGAANRARARKREFLLNKRHVSIPLRVYPDEVAHTARIVLGTHDVEIAEGEWVRDLPVRFEVTDSLPVDALVSVRLESCRLTEDGASEVRLFVPPVALDPRTTRCLTPIAWPRTYGQDLWDRAGPFRTVGWDVATNPFKDEEIGPQALLETVETSLDADRRLLDAELERGDFDVLFSCVEVADRAGCVLLGFAGDHPPARFDGSPWPEEVSAFGDTFPLRDALRRVYRECDTLVGAVAARVAAGEFGDDALLLVLSDHGVAPFLYGASLNVWLEREGLLTRKRSSEARSESPPFLSGDVPDYIDWSHTRACAMGLGKVYLNLAGREPEGIVLEQEKDALLRDLADRLEAWIDPKTGARVVRKAHLARDLYHGPHEEADVIVGFEPPYRVSWGSTLGGFEEEALDRAGIVDNPLAWAADHSCDASAVPGVLFATRPLPKDLSPDLLDVAPTVLGWVGVPVPVELEGRRIFFR